MDEQFDEKLKNRITEVFDNYEFPPADEAWLELRKKFPVKEERKVAWLWWSSAAAILMVFLGLGVWFNNKQDSNTTVAGTHGKLQNHANNPDSVTQVPKDPHNSVAQNPSQQLPVFKPGNSNPIDTSNVTTNPAVTNNHNTAGVTKALVKKRAPALNNAPVVLDNTLNNTAVIKNPIAKKNEPAANTTPDTEKGAVNNVALQTQNPATVAGNLPANKQNPPVVNPAQQQVAVNTVPPVTTEGGNNNQVAGNKPGSLITKPPTKTLQDLFNETKPPLVAQQKAEKKELKKVNFSVFAATYLNYAEGSANQVNAGAGFTSDIRLGKKVKLSTGVSLAQNTLSYAGTVPVSSSNRALSASYSSPTVADGLFNPAASVAELKGTNASLVGLDIPINIKYEFNPDKTDTYISAGLSSGTFIDERYTYRYAYHNYNSNALGNSAVTTQDQSTSQSFNSFYFGKTLNLSFGTGFPIGKTNRLVIEPFLKYPLGGLGVQNIHFGAGGINLKFNFKATKK